MQQVLRNPLASPTTLGVASGAQLALMMVTLLAPSWLLIGREWIAMAGEAWPWGWSSPWLGAVSSIPWSSSLQGW
jgi:iron complex transport system permease protein